MRDAAGQLQTTGEVALEDITLGVIHTQKRVVGPHFMVQYNFKIKYLWLFIL